MADDRCECCDNLPGQCGQAAQQKQAQQLRDWRIYLARCGWFRAIYSGTCQQCNHDFRPGVMIRNKGIGKYVAECCAPAGPKAKT